MAGGAVSGEPSSYPGDLAQQSSSSRGGAQQQPAQSRVLAETVSEEQPGDVPAAEAPPGEALVQPIYPAQLQANRSEAVEQPAGPAEAQLGDGQAAQQRTSEGGEASAQAVSVPGASQDGAGVAVSTARGGASSGNGTWLDDGAAHTLR